MSSDIFQRLFWNTDISLISKKLTSSAESQWRFICTVWIPKCVGSLWLCQWHLLEIMKESMGIDWAWRWCIHHCHNIMTNFWFMYACSNDNAYSIYFFFCWNSIISWNSNHRLRLLRRWQKCILWVRSFLLGKVKMKHRALTYKCEWSKQSTDEICLVMVTQALSLVSQILALLCGRLLLITDFQNDKLKYLHGAGNPHQVWLDTKHLSDAVLLQLYAALWVSDMKVLGFVFLSIILSRIYFHTITFCPG